MTTDTLNDRYPSPLRYPGGKRKLTNFVKLLIDVNKMYDIHYFEPYAGGATIPLSLLFEEYARRVYINDLNPSVYAFWFSVLNHTEELCQKILNAKLSIEEREAQRGIQQDSSASVVDLGFSTFYLNRVNRSGIIAGGVIGGKSQNGPWDIGARFNKVSLINRIRKIARYRHRISLYNLDALDFLALISPNLPSHSLIYLDPPYYAKGRDLYQNFYSHKDHVEVAQLVQTLQARWIVSYDAHPALLPLYSQFRAIHYGLKYSAQERYTGSEVMFFSDSLVIPEVRTPANLALKSVLTDL